MFLTIVELLFYYGQQTKFLSLLFVRIESIYCLMLIIIKNLLKKKIRNSYTPKIEN